MVRKLKYLASPRGKAVTNIIDGFLTILSWRIEFDGGINIGVKWENK